MLLKKLLQPFFAAYVLVAFTATLSVALPPFLLLSIGNSVSSRRAIYSLLCVWSRAWLLLIGMPVRTLGQRPPEGRYIIVANHISYLDTIVLFPTLPQYFRPLGKKEFSRVPLLGFLYKQITIMVDRGSQKSRQKSIRLLWRVLKHEGDILIFPEGTFNETGNKLKDFYDGAFRLAITTQHPVLPVVFPDTVHRWHYSGWWKWWPGVNRGIYLPPISVSGMTLTDLPALKAQVYDAMENELAKYNYP